MLAAVSKAGNEQQPRYSLSVPLDRPESEAWEAMQEYIRALKAAHVKESGYKIGDLAELYLEDRAKEGKTDYVKVRRYIWKRNLKPTFGDLSPSSLLAPVEVDGEERTICHKYGRERQLAGKSVATIYNEMSLVASIINWAAKKKLCEKIPIWRPVEPDPRERVISIQELYKLIDACEHHHLKLFVVIAGSTGARLRAILDLTWDRIDLERRTVDFRVKQVNKNILDKSTQKGRAASVDMNDMLFDALVHAKGWARSNYVIEWNGKPVKSVKKGLAKAFEKAGIEGKFNGSHLLRHSLATWIADAGYDLRIVQRLFGHKTPKSTGRYAKHQRGYLSSAVAVVDRQLSAAE